MTQNNLLSGGVLGAVLCLSACAEQGYSVVAATGTTIGIEISQSPSNGQTPKFVLGYNRAELAFVPTNRPSNDKTPLGSNGLNGAQQSADVLMELRYGGGVGGQVDTSIYQRVAVGTTAVQQKGAAFLFAKSATGEVSPEAAAAIGADPAVLDALVENQNLLVAEVSGCLLDGNGKIIAERRRSANRKDCCRQPRSKRVDHGRFCHCEVQGRPWKGSFFAV